MSHPPSDFLPPEITVGELAAIGAADRNGWIVPPVYCCLAPPQQRTWSAAHLQYLKRRGMVRQRVRRGDGQFLYQLNERGEALRA